MTYFSAIEGSVLYKFLLDKGFKVVSITNGLALMQGEEW